MLFALLLASVTASNPWTTLAWAIAGVWCFIAVIFVVALRRRAILRVSDNDEQTDLPKLSVLVAARNETLCIESCIRSLFRQDYPNLEVVAINDRSTDDTGAILDLLAAEFGQRLQVVHITSLPAGWFGKPNALTAGVQNATGSVICFTDADCVFQASGALRTAVGELLQRKLDVMSIAARYSMDSLREQVLVPCVSEMLLTWLHPERVDDPNCPDAFANGAFILVQRAPFERIGGWSTLRAKICEDLEFARLAKQSGLRTGVVQAENFYVTGSYQSLRESWNGWSRIFKGALTPAQLLQTLIRMSCLFVLPFAATWWTVGSALGSGSIDGLINGSGLAFLIAFSFRTALDVAIFRLVGAPMRAAVLAPLGRFFVMAAAMRALLSHAGLVKTHWRGAAFLAGQMVMPQPVRADSRIP